MSLILAETDAMHGVAGTIRSSVEIAATAVELLSVAIILIGIAGGLVRLIVRRGESSGTAYHHFRIQVAKAMLLGLELLVAADIARTVILEPSIQNLLGLALLVAVRTFLSWTLVVEVEGRWPWSAGPRPETTESSSSS